jgi:hypothetical protein
MPITKEQLKRLNAAAEDGTFDEVQKEIFDSVAKADGYKTPEDIQGLKDKNGELIGKIKVLQGKVLTDDQKKILDKLENSSIMTIDDVEKLLNADPKDPKGGDDDAVNKQIKMLQKQLEDQQQRTETEKAQRLTETKKSVIDKALSAANLPTHLHAHFATQADVLEQDGKVSVVWKDDPDGLCPPIADHINQWSKTEEAKIYIKAPNSSGAGSGSGSGSGSSQAGGNDDGSVFSENDFS